MTKIFERTTVDFFAVLLDMPVRQHYYKHHKYFKYHYIIRPFVANILRLVLPYTVYNFVLQNHFQTRLAFNDRQHKKRECLLTQKQSPLSKASHVLQLPKTMHFATLLKTIGLTVKCSLPVRRTSNSSVYVKIYHG